MNVMFFCNVVSRWAKLVVVFFAECKIVTDGDLRIHIWVSTKQRPKTADQRLKTQLSDAERHKKDRIFCFVVYLGSNYKMKIFAKTLR